MEIPIREDRLRYEDMNMVHLFGCMIDDSEVTS